MLFLASASPRRAELLEQIGVEYKVYPAHIDESRHGDESPADYVVRIAAAKADKVAAELGREKTGDFVLAADTTVAVDGEVLGKPENPDDARLMLQRLSGRKHSVLTAVTLISDQGMDSRLSQSQVQFRSLTRQEIETYCQLPEPSDKAGAYAIQGLAAIFVADLQGSYSGVMGLPLMETAELLENANFKVLR